MITKSLLAIACLCLLSVWYFFQKTTSFQSVGSTSIALVSSPQLNDNPKKQQSKSSQDSTERAEAGDPEVTIVETAIEQGLSQIAQQFTVDMQFPEISYPIFDEAVLPKYQSNRGAPVFFQEGAQVVRVTTNQYLYESYDQIEVDIKLENIAQGELLLAVKSAAGTFYETVMQVDKSHFTTTIPALGQQWTSDEAYVVATVTTLKQSLVVSTPIKKAMQNQSPVSLSGFESAFVDGPWLVIPANVLLEEPGFYRFEANLYSANTGKPLVHLSVEDELTAGSAELHLKAHISALKVKGDAGDYVLKDFHLERMPSAPDYETTNGQLFLKDRKISGFSFDQYRDEAFQDEEVQARLDFLSKATH